MNRKPDTDSTLASHSSKAESQQTSSPVQARFGYDFSRLALTRDSVTPLQRAAPEEEEALQGKVDAAAPVQRAGPEEEELQMKADPAAIQRAGPEEELQMKTAGTGTVQRVSGKSNQTGLPDNLKSGVENLSGMSLDDVNVQYNSSQPKAVGALAYAQGSNIHVASGQEKHLPHEAWHVVQQKQGRVQPTFQMKTGVGINDDQGLETEADVMGAKALANSAQSQRTEEQRSPTQRKRAPESSETGIVQRERSLDASTLHSAEQGATFGSQIVQRKGGKKANNTGTFIGDKDAHHLHLDIAKPHYKFGDDESTRMDLRGRGPGGYGPARLLAVATYLQGMATQPGAQACIDWCQS